MTPFHERLASAAAQNARILQTLSETSYSVAELQQNKSYVSTLKKHIALDEKTSKEVTYIVDAAFLQKKKYRNSHVRRLAYKIGGKKDQFEADATKEEKEWLDAVAIQLQVKQSLDHFKAKLREATAKGSELEAVLGVYTSAERELLVLYKSIFDGPTPELPGEDMKEYEFTQAENNFNNIGGLLSAEKQAQEILHDADRFMKAAIENIIAARQASTMDTWGGGSVFASMEQNALSSCQNRIQQVELLIQQAQRLQPAVRSLGDTRIAQMNFMTNVIFDNIFSDLELRARIKDSQARLERAQATLREELRASDERAAGVQAKFQEAKVLAEQKRKELQQIRQTAFERFANDMNDGGAPPPYEADKVDKFNAWA